MDYHTLPKPDALSNFSLMDTITSGQTFQWLPADSIHTDEQTYTFPETTENTAYLPARVNNKPVIYEVTDDTTTHLKWRLVGSAMDDPEPYKNYLTHRLGFTFPYETALAELEATDPALASDANTNLSLLQDPPFPTLISFICSPQAPLSRIYTMMRNIEHKYGEHISTHQNHEMYCFPTPENLATATEEVLREYKLGYRAPYVTETSNLVAQETPPLPPIDTNQSTDELRTTLTEYMGVGEKVADCVLLYAYNRTSVTPIDTRIQQIVTDRYDNSVSTTTQAKNALHNALPEEYCGYYQLLLYDLAGDS